MKHGVEHAFVGVLAEQADRLVLAVDDLIAGTEIHHLPGPETEERLSALLIRVERDLFLHREELLLCHRNNLSVSATRADFETIDRHVHTLPNSELTDCVCHGHTVAVRTDGPGYDATLVRQLISTVRSNYPRERCPMGAGGCDYIVPGVGWPAPDSGWQRS